jgi:hypothetical protein
MTIGRAFTLEPEKWKSFLDRPTLVIFRKLD